jgi:hypothetical protein
LSAAIVSGSFTFVALIAAVLHALNGRQASSDLGAIKRYTATEPVAVEAARMLRRQEIARTTMMLCLAVAGMASFLHPPWRSIVAFAIFVVPFVSIADSMLTRRSVARQLAMAQNRPQ